MAQSQTAGECYQMFKELTLILHKFFQKLEERKTSDSSHKANINLTWRDPEESIAHKHAQKPSNSESSVLQQTEPQHSYNFYLKTSQCVPQGKASSFSEDQSM